jgi:hypothetical protein
MTVYTYPVRELIPDYARAAAGLLITVAPLPWLLDSPIAFTVAAVLTLAFAAYGLMTVARQLTRIDLDPGGIHRTGFRAMSLPWAALKGLELRYYSVRRDKQRGWMQLRLQGPDGRLVLDSTLDGFAEVAKRAFAAARANGLPLGEPTLANLRALGPDLSEMPWLSSGDGSAGERPSRGRAR